jgi:AAA+ superfamily predicted ATPase
MGDSVAKNLMYIVFLLFGVHQQLDALGGAIGSVLFWPAKKTGEAFFRGIAQEAKQQFSAQNQAGPQAAPAQPRAGGPAPAPQGGAPQAGRPPGQPGSVESAVHTALETFFTSLATKFGHPDQAGSQMIRNLSQSSVRQFGQLFIRQNPDEPSEGEILLNNIVRAIGETCSQEGAAKEAINSFFAMLDRLANDPDLRANLETMRRRFFEEFDAVVNEFRIRNRNQDGSIRQAARALQENISEQIKGIGESINEQYGNVAFTTVASGASLITTWYGSRVLWNYIERAISRPKLILESSQKSLWQSAKGLFVEEQVHLPEMVFEPVTKRRLDNIAAAAKNIRRKIKEGQKNVKYRNLLLWGPPGTGKTMFARVLAHSSGMEYAMMSGASFAQFKDGEGITEMNKLFAWAEASEGLLIFVDESESFLGGRVGSDVTQESYQLLNNFLNHTGTRSDKVMFVFATNHPDFLDQAMMRRIDDSVELKLPDLIERAKIIQLYRNKILLDKTQNSEQFVSSALQHLNDEEIEHIANKTAGLSGGELEGIINTIITDTNITDSGLVSKLIVDEAVDQAIKKNREFNEGFQKNSKLIQPDNRP